MADTKILICGTEATVAALRHRVEATGASAVERTDAGGVSLGAIERALAEDRHGAIGAVYFDPSEGDARDIQAIVDRCWSDAAVQALSRSDLYRQAA